MNKNELQTQMNFANFISTEQMKDRLQTALGNESQRFMSSIISAVANNPQLSECTNKSIISGALLGEGLKLSPSPQLGQFYLVPFNIVKEKDKNGKAIAWEKVAQFQLGYKGYIQLAIRSGQYRDIDVIDVKEGEYLGRNSHTGKYQFSFIQDEDERDSKETIGYMAYFEYLNGFTKQIYWTKEQMENHATKYSQAYANDKKKKTSYSFWTSNFDGMAFKTMLRQLISKWGVMSVEFQRAFESDMATIEDEKPRYIDNEADTPELTIINEIVEKKEVKLSELSNNK